MDAVILQSLGAAETVTGSKHLLKTPGFNILIDCGLFQGIKSLREQNWNPLPIKASAIDVVILTHAHLDHCGYLPVLVRNGFKGHIYMTRPTAALAQLILLDSAKIQEEDAENANRHHYTKHHPAKPLYTIDEARRCFNYFRTEDQDTHLELNEHISFRFKLSGHILGASSVEITCYGKTIVFSGDIGRTHSTILADPEKLVQADYVIMESTYGDRIHSNSDPYAELETWINKTLENNGQIIIPSFAVGRAQELLYIIHILKSQNRIPANLPVVMDSPMAAAATEILLNYADEFTEVSEKAWRELMTKVKVNVEYTQTLRTLNDNRSKIVIAASGMLSGGRVLEYLKHYIGSSNNSVIIIGFQAEGTRGRALLNGTHELKIHGQYYPVRASVAEIIGLSAHADQTELMHWVKATGAHAKQIILVHGEAASQQSLRVKIQTELGFSVMIAKQGQDTLLFTCEELAASTNEV
jgi:metallo-beta-lactamase family protein